MKAYVGMEVLFNAFLTAALDGSQCLASCTSRCNPGGRAAGTFRCMVRCALELVWIWQRKE